MIRTRVPDNRLSPMVVGIGVVLLVGYLLIVISILFSSDGTSVSLEELSAARMQAELVRRDLLQAQSEIKRLRSSTSDGAAPSKKHESPPKNTHPSAVNTAITTFDSLAYRPGVVILGMHRSGTSLLGGLITKMGLQTGGPLIQAAEDNPKGFFERIDVVLQDDTLMARQNVHYSHNTYKYNALQGTKDILAQYDEKFFAEGRRGLAFLNNPSNYPWMLKDPRLCITLRSWLPLLNFQPVVLFSYRHPLDVALSMNTRGFEKFKINKGLRIWYMYNRRAIENSQDLCRVVTSHRKVMKDTMSELQHIHAQLVQCGVPVPHMPSEAEVGEFVDIKLQHGKNSLGKEECDGLGGVKGGLDSLRPPSTWPTTEDDHISLYKEVMRVYCAMEGGQAFKADFKWNDKVKDD
eukprot:gene28533-34443_t